MVSQTPEMLAGGEHIEMTDGPVSGVRKRTSFANKHEGARVFIRELNLLELS